MKHENIVATDEMSVYYVKYYEDGSAALVYDNGYTEGVWCVVDRLRAHLLHIANVCHGKNWNSLIPDYWKIVDSEFFEKLGIY